MLNRPVQVLLATGVLLLTVGCKSITGGNCHKPQAYEDAGEVPTLRMPVGMDGPDTRNALQIPALNEPEVPRGPDDPCLDEPPRVLATGATGAAPAAAPAAEAADAPQDAAERRRRRPPLPR